MNSSHHSFITQGAAVAFYILSALFVNNFVIIFVVTVFLSALDFWVVKNVSGRILVGLRWWNEINDLGESVWKFESLDQEACSFLTPLKFLMFVYKPFWSSGRIFAFLYIFVHKILCAHGYVWCSIIGLVWQLHVSVDALLKLDLKLWTANSVAVTVVFVNCGDMNQLNLKSE